MKREETLKIKLIRFQEKLPKPSIFSPRFPFVLDLKHSFQCTLSICMYISKMGKVKEHQAGHFLMHFSQRFLDKRGNREGELKIKRKGSSAILWPTVFINEVVGFGAYSTVSFVDFFTFKGYNLITAFLPFLSSLQILP